LRGRKGLYLITPGKKKKHPIPLGGKKRKCQEKKEEQLRDVSRGGRGEEYRGREALIAAKVASLHMPGEKGKKDDRVRGG